MNNIVKKVVIIIIVIIFIIAFSASYTSLNIDNLAIVVAMGIDTSTSNNVKVTFQFTNASSVSESGTTEKSESILNTIDASSITSAINIMNTYIGKSINLSHCKVIVFSEEFAKQGISNEIYTLINNVQIRPSANIVVSKCDASYYIDNSKPLLEPLITKYYEIFSSSSKFTGYTANATIGDFFNSLISNSSEPYAILGGINTSSGQESTSSENEKDSNIKANESPLHGQIVAENTGLAVFKDAQLVGELNAIETLSFLTFKDKLESFCVSVPDPESKTSYLDLILTPSKNTSINVDIVNGSPYIKINCKYSGKIASVTKDSKYLNPKLLNSVSKSCNNYLETIFSSYLYKTSIDLKSDINSFGKSSLIKFLSTKDFNEFNWNQSYKNSFFNVHVNTNITSGGLITET